MRAADGDAAFQAHQFGQHLGTADDGNALRARRHQFRIVALDRRRDHEHVGTGDILRGVADMDGDALLAQTVHIRVFRGVRSLNSVAEIAQHLGDATHADATDADKMNGSDLARQSHGAISVVRHARRSTGHMTPSNRRGWPGQARP